MEELSGAHFDRAYRRYSRVAIFLHWAIAALILFNIVTGFFRGDMPRGTMALHMSAGMTILALTVVRVVWRLTDKPPPFLPMRAWERWLARSVHFLLYAAMLIMPISGWAIISANPPPGSPGAEHVRVQNGAPPVPAGQPAPRRTIWGVIPFPMISPVHEMGRMPEGVDQQQVIHDRAENVHGVGALILLFLLLLHIGGAMKHQFINRDPELARMGIGRGLARKR